MCQFTLSSFLISRRMASLISSSCCGNACSGMFPDNPYLLLSSYKMTGCFMYSPCIAAVFGTTCKENRKNTNQILEYMRKLLNRWYDMMRWNILLNKEWIGYGVYYSYRDYANRFWYDYLQSMIMRTYDSTKLSVPEHN